MSAIGINGKPYRTLAQIKAELEEIKLILSTHKYPVLVDVEEFYNTPQGGIDDFFEKDSQEPQN